MKDEWRTRAEGDLAVARLALDSDLVDAAAFHVQQGLEKALKMLLVERGERPPKIHNLITLSESLGDPAPFTPVELREVTVWVASGRYPGSDEPSPPVARVRDLLARVEAWLTTLP